VLAGGVTDQRTVVQHTRDCSQANACLFGDITDGGHLDSPFDDYGTGSNPMITHIALICQAFFRYLEFSSIRVEIG
jgi:hypothetical protein